MGERKRFRGQFAAAAASGGGPSATAAGRAATVKEVWRTIRPAISSNAMTIRLCVIILAATLGLWLIAKA
ncbi:hypothetical protein ABZX90_17110 [Streptomyces sp. NPDC002935]|uniref:hypothetical protein n=1 Tax=Streptomyces sp. NPDC002935 TaxID=3154545 RepID=UPI0033AF73B6